MKYFVEISGKRILVDLPNDGSKSNATIDGVPVILDYERGQASAPDSLLMDGRSYVIDMEAVEEGFAIQINGADLQAAVIDERKEAIARLTGLRKAKSEHAGEIKAPMPGLIIKVEVEEGDKIAKGSGLIVIEAMKMENELPAPVAGLVSKIKVSKGDVVEKGQLLLVVKPE